MTLLLVLNGAWWPAAALAQQALVGVVTDRATSAPLPGVFVALEERGVDRVVSAVLTDESGRFVLSAQLGRTYRLRAERVGLSTELTDWFVFAAEGALQRIGMVERAVELEGLSVSGQVRTCQLERGEAVLVQRWWDEVRKALQATAFGQEREIAELRFQRFEREWSSNLRALRHERELPPDSAPTRPFLSQEAESLSEKGFIQGQEGDRLFLAPDATVLLSATFLADHCLSVGDVPESHVGRPGELYLAVEPIRDHPPDIQGSLTVDTIAGELRAFDFTYTNLPPDLPRTRAGGHLTFAYLPSGAWIVSDWWVRVPRVEYRWGEGDRRGAVPLVQGYVDQGGRSVDVEGRPVQPERGVDRTTVHGMVFDSLSGGPMVGARISIVGTRYSARTGEDGHFTLAGVPAGRRALTVHHAELSRLGLPSPVFAVDLIANAEDSVVLATPGFATTASLLCPAPPDGPAEAVLTGNVMASNGPAVAPLAEVRARWVSAERGMVTEGKAGSEGRYVLCGLPADVPIAVAVRTDSQTWRDAGTVRLAGHRIAAVDLKPGTEALAVLRGTVRDAEDGAALPGAEVRVLAVTGDTVASAHANESGAFQLNVPPGVGYRAVADATGHLREASAAFTLDGAESLDIAFELSP
ncbi:MAG TPA: carboxypeptidase-like regulatory domain-containing protein, partial [Gemmatimonadales bacterium]|nr:carboxypeptidase-like regulatory domain-containing protein [Gemmatimonadales bacterium]